MPEIGDLPDEVFLQIFPYCPLKSLIAAVGVCTLWKTTIPKSDIDKTRRGLLNLYFTIIDSPVFERSRPWLLENLRPFDRQAYIDALLDQHDYLPDDFRIWILEWPAKAVIACCWPGLPAKYYGAHEADGIERVMGYNSLGCIPPVVHTVTFTRIGRSEDDVKIDVPALRGWVEVDGDPHWIVLEQKPICSHAVYRLPNARYDGDAEDGDPNQSDGETEDGDLGQPDGAKKEYKEPQGDYDAKDAQPDGEKKWKEPQGDYAFLGVYSSWTYWLLTAFQNTEEVAEMGPSDVMPSGPHEPDGTPLTSEEYWSRLQAKQTQMVWAETHNTGRRGLTAGAT